MWAYNKNPDWIGNYWCYLSDGSIEILRVSANGWYRCLDGETYSDCKDRNVLAWWEEEKPKEPDKKQIEEIKKHPPLHIDN